MNTRSFLTLCVALTATLLVPTQLFAQDAKINALMKGESLGGLKLGQGEKDVTKLLGKPKTASKLEKQEADGTYAQILEFTDKKVVITLNAGEKKTGTKAVTGINVESSDFATKLGIKVGSTLDEVRKAYGKFENKAEGSPEMFIAGARDAGLIFDLESGKVTRIFLGSAGE